MPWAPSARWSRPRSRPVPVPGPSPSSQSRSLSQVPSRPVPFRSVRPVPSVLSVLFCSCPSPGPSPSPFPRSRPVPSPPVPSRPIPGQCRVWFQCSACCVGSRCRAVLCEVPVQCFVGSQCSAEWGPSALLSGVPVQCGSGPSAVLCAGEYRTPDDAPSSPLGAAKGPY